MFTVNITHFMAYYMQDEEQVLLIAFKYGLSSQCRNFTIFFFIHRSVFKFLLSIGLSYIEYDFFFFHLQIIFLFVDKSSWLVIVLLFQNLTICNRIRDWDKKKKNNDFFKKQIKNFLQYFEKLQLSKNHNGSMIWNITDDII